MNTQNKSQLQTISRLLIIVASLFLFVSILLPIWRIELDAPQYPEGLTMYIHANKVGGEIEIINGLNHYIGMKEIHEDEFKEFVVLPYMIAGLGVFGLIAAIMNRRWMLYTFFAALILFALGVGIDFYMWLYDYGHNLDPNAAIQVPGMTYQPPMIGFKQLLNFGVFSIPDNGGWLLVGSGVILAGISFYEWKVSKSNK
jgi:copper chaperone NosL